MSRDQQTVPRGSLGMTDLLHAPSARMYVQGKHPSLSILICVEAGGDGDCRWRWRRVWLKSE